ncbi:MAG: family 20 glycosylhydrolase [Rikenellaceae bacterium]
MKIIRTIFTLLLSLSVLSTVASVIPKPQHFVKKETQQYFEFDASTQWVLPVEGAELMWSVIEPLSTSFERVSGYEYQYTSKRVKCNFVEVKIDKGMRDEEYRIDVDKNRVLIQAATHRGVFYATQTIRQLLPTQIESSERISHDIIWSLPLVEVQDAPAIEYRGFMIDVSRHFTPKDNLLEIIDILGVLKINTLQLHLVDDNGWRIEIKRYPKLTEIGAWSVDREEYFSARSGPNPGEPTTKGGFYTQDDIREIVAYASQRAIEVIPEIEMPAHTMSSLAAYPEMSCSPEGKFLGVLPGYVGHNNHTPTYCAGKDEVYEFLENILLEVIELFPSERIHVGGDEAPPIHWAECEHCKKIMEREGYTDPHMVQSYFMKRMGEFIASQGKVLVGWDELVDSPMPENAMIVGWRGDGSGAFKAGELGHKYVMAPAKTLYFIRYQGPQWFEPRTYFGNVTLENVYNYKPLPDNLSEKCRSNFIGTQACLWSEFVESTEDAQYLIFPRLMAYSENAWCSYDALDWDGFLPRLDEILSRLDVMEIEYARSMYNLDHKVKPVDGKLSVSVSSIRSDVEVRYTLKNNVARPYDQLWGDDLSIDKSTTIAAATFKDGVQQGQTLLLPVTFNKATAKPISCVGVKVPVDLLVNGVRGSDKPSDFEWCGWYRVDGEFIVDLESTQHISHISLGEIMDNTLAIGLAKRVVVSYSTDGEQYTTILDQQRSAEQCFEQVIAVKDILITNLDIEARYVKVEFENPGKITAHLPRGGQDCYVYFDEIIIE